MVSCDDKKQLLREGQLCYKSDTIYFTVLNERTALNPK